MHGHGSVTTSAFGTVAPGEVLLAFVGSDGPGGAGKQSVTVSGAGLHLEAGEAREWPVRRR